jgi:GT2 family glycosyltransferase
MKKIAIVTLDYNNHEDTLEWLKSFQNLDTKDLEILTLVVDNGSDTSIKETVAGFPGVIWMQTGKNLGFAGGFNRGMKYAKEWGADYILIINNDTLFPDEKILTKMLDVFRKNKKAGVVSPKIYFAPGYEFYKEKYKKEEIGNVIWYAGGTFDWDNIRSVHRGIDEVDAGKYDMAEKTEFINGCCILIKREVLEKVGYFEEKLFAYFEDNDWTERVYKAGFEKWYAGSTSIYHKVSRTAGIGSTWSDYLITRNRLWFGMRYARPRTKFALVREAMKLLIIGRAAQKEGILDYLRGIYGWKRAKQPEYVEYPLELSIVIINYKTTQLMLQLLESIFNKKSGYGNVKGGAEVVVLDNSPDEPCDKEVLAIYPNIKFISNPENNGFSGGNNQLINYSLGKYVLLLNSDIKLKEGSITKLMESVDKMGDRAIYAGKLYFPTGEEQDNVYLLPTAWHAFEQYFLNKKGSYFMYVPNAKNPVKVEGAVMACFLIPRKVINEIGVLQEETFMYFEDIEYSRRAGKAGIPIYFIPKAHFIHFHGQASKKAGVNKSNDRLIAAAKWYHGPVNYFLVTSVLWAGQKWNKVKAPLSRWKSE